MLKSNKLRARNSIILLAIIFILSVVSIISDLMQYALLNSEIGFTVEEGEQNDLRQQIIAIFMVVAYVLSYTFFIMWFRRAYFNLHQKVNNLEFSEGWAAGAWFVPILNYIRPYQIIKELYVETENYLVKNKSNYTKTLNLSFIGIWWASWIIVSIFDRISYRLTANSETIEELSNVHGVGEGKAKKYGKEFIELIERYVEDNDIIRPDDLVVKSTGANSALKLYIIQNVDRKLSLNDIAKAKGLDMDALLKEMEQIVYSGTKLNIKYWIDDILDDDQQEEIHDYFMDSHSDKIQDALDEFDGDYDTEELRLMRIKFISEVAN